MINAVCERGAVLQQESFALPVLRFSNQLCFRAKAFNPRFQEGIEVPSCRRPYCFNPSEGAPILDLGTIIKELKSERDKMARAIAALIEGTGASGRGATRKVKRKRRGGITSAGRRRLSLAMKKRWAARRAKNRSAKAAAPKRRGRLTPAGRKKLSDAMKKRWAEKKAKAS